MMQILLYILLVSTAYGANFTFAPILTIHGIHDHGNFDIVNSLGKYFDTYSQCYQIGEADPDLFSIFYNIRHQGKILGDNIHNDPYLKDGNFSINAISQGAVIAKYIIEYCPLRYPVRNLVTFGGPNMGVSSVPTFPRETWTGYFLTILVNQIIYWDIAQWLVAPADYWRDPQNTAGYLKHSRFLAEANNEVNFNQTRKDLWLNLKYCIFVKWESDTTIIPRESEWWGHLTSDLNIISRFDSEIYKKDLIGIKTLEESGRADFISIPGDHMHFNTTQINSIVEKAFIK